MKKSLQRYQVQSHRFFLPSHNSMYEKQAQSYNPLHHSHESSPFPTTFSLRSKDTVTTTPNQVLRGKRMRMMVYGWYFDTYTYCSLRSSRCLCRHQGYNWKSKVHIPITPALSNPPQSTLQTQNRILGVGDLTQHQHPLNRKVFKFVHTAVKVVLHMCLLG
jgi:hypothetical protein